MLRQDVIISTFPISVHSISYGLSRADHTYTGLCRGTHVEEQVSVKVTLAADYTASMSVHAPCASRRAAGITIIFISSVL
jgi:hypothetical protein